MVITHWQWLQVEFTYKECDIRHTRKGASANDTGRIKYTHCNTTGGAGTAALPEHMSSPPVIRSLVLCVMFCSSLFVLVHHSREIIVMSYLHMGIPVVLLALAILIWTMKLTEYTLFLVLIAN
jgi:hypothetical protein